MSLTPEQRQAAHAPGSVSITAGAGTGKTYMLAERYYFHLAAMDLSPLEIVAMTFTDAAAAELRSRIRRAIAHHAPERTDWLAEVEAAQISTFHALASRICREHPEAAGVPADFTTLDDWESQIWLAEQLTIALDLLPPAFYEKIPYSLMGEAIAELLKDPLTAKAALEKTIADWQPYLHSIQQQIIKQLLQSDCWLDAKEIITHHIGKPGDKLETVRQIALDTIEKIEFYQSEFTEDLFITAFNTLKQLSVGNIGSKANWYSQDILKQVRQTIIDLRNFLKGFPTVDLIGLQVSDLDQQNQRYITILKEAFDLVWQQIATVKKQQRILDFNDLEIYALQALKSPEVCAYYHQRWQAFLIDEFQDTNPTQGKLLEILTAKATLTIVGDDKQAIYGFRRADVEVFQVWRSRLKKSVALTTSFRTHQALIHKINTVFAPVLGDLHQNLTGDRQPEPHPAPHLEVLTITVPKTIDPKPSKNQRRREEAQQIAVRLATMLQEKLPIWDKQQQCLRPLEPRDIAILSRTWSPLEIYGQALAQWQIPFLQCGGGNLLDTREAKDAIALLQFLANPADNLALIALLRSPFFCISDRQLYTYQSSQSPESKTQHGVKWWQQLKTQVHSGQDPDLENAIHILQQLLNQRDRQAPTRLLQWADRLTGYTAIISNLPNAKRRLADWYGIIDMVRQLEAGIADVLIVVRRLRRIIKSQIKIKRPPLEAENAVSLMTIHASKGLEWSVVIVPDLTRSKSNHAAKILFEPHLGVALQTESESGDAEKSALFLLLQKQHNQRETAEAKRLLYVALTRARDRLLLTATDEKGKDLDILKPGLENHCPIENIDYNTTSLNPITPLNPFPSQTTKIPKKLLLQRPRLNALELPITALTEYARCPRQFYYHHIEGHPGLTQGITHHGAAIGSLTHKALEKNITQQSHLKKYAPNLPETAHSEALELAHKFRQNKIYQAVRQGTWEKYVSLNKGRLILNGFADLVGDDFILDIKTDQQIKPLTYRFQLWAYTKATQKRQAYIAYLRHDVLYHFSETTFNEIDQEAEDLCHHIEEQNYSPKPSSETCQYCPYREPSLCDVAVNNP